MKKRKEKQKTDFVKNRLFEIKNYSFPFDVLSGIVTVIELLE